MLPYFPFQHEHYTMSVGARPLDHRPLIEVDLANYHAELSLKHAILAENQPYYVQALPWSEAAQWEALALVLRDLARHQPDMFTLETRGGDWTWHNRLLNITATFRYGDLASLPCAPLDWVGRHVQEDLLLLANDEQAGFPLVAGQLCFANRWCLDEKMGRSFLDIHAPVPQFNEHVGRSSHLLMARLKPERPVWRLNWSIKANNRLNLASCFGKEDEASKQGITAEDAGARCWLRVERQVMARLPETGAVLFTIHTYQASIAELTCDPSWARSMLGVLRTTPNDMLVYKGIAPFAEPLCAYLENRLSKA